MIPQPGQFAPDFLLADQDGQKRRLRDYQGQWVLLYFYPKDDTVGCTKEACMLRDEFPNFDVIGATVIGVSIDSVRSHKHFADKYRLPFTLLSDPERRVVDVYGVWGKKKFMGKEYEGTKRVSFLIDPQGRIVKVYEVVRPESHAKEVVKDLRDLLELENNR